VNASVNAGVNAHEANATTKYDSAVSTQTRDPVVPVRIDSTTTLPKPPAAARAFPEPVLADARSIARTFVTLLNQRRWQEVSRLGLLRGDTTLRAELIRLVRNGADFAAGFTRVASAPEVLADGFVTECVLDLEWRGGRRSMVAELHVAYRDGSWQLSSFRLEPASTSSH
jgi:hypothetical protein